MPLINIFRVELKSDSLSLYLVVIERLERYNNVSTQQRREFSFTSFKISKICSWRTRESFLSIWKICCEVKKSIYHK